MKNKRPKNALICVDPQMDFMPVSKEDYKNKKGGALAVTDGDKIVPIINWLIESVKFDHIVVTGDLHPEDNIYFASQHEGKQPFDQLELNGKMETLWPDHCVRNTPGCKFHPDLKIPEHAKIFYKGREKKYHPYSGFGDEFDTTGLDNYLKDMDVEEVYIVGLATDYCSGETALDAVGEGYETYLILDGCRGIASDLTKTYKKLTDEGVQLINSTEIK